MNATAEDQKWIIDRANEAVDELVEVAREYIANGRSDGGTVLMLTRGSSHINTTEPLAMLMAVAVTRLAHEPA